MREKNEQFSNEIVYNEAVNFIKSLSFNSNEVRQIETGKELIINLPDGRSIKAASAEEKEDVVLAPEIMDSEVANRLAKQLLENGKESIMFKVATPTTDFEEDNATIIQLSISK